MRAAAEFCNRYEPAPVDTSARLLLQFDPVAKRGFNIGVPSPDSFAPDPS